MQGQTQLDLLQQRVYGNGQPGDIQKIQTRLDEQDDRMDKQDIRVNQLEKVIERWAWKGLVTAVLIGTTTGGGTFTLSALIGYIRSLNGGQ